MQPWKKFEYRIRDYFQKKGFKSERIPVSGSAAVIKGDVIAEKGNVRFRVDAKSTTGKKGIRIKRESLEKISSEAGKNEIPLVVFSFYRHHTLYAILEKGAIPELRGKNTEKTTWARDSIGLTREEVIEATDNRSALLFSFKGDDAEFAIVRLDDLIRRLC